LVLRDEQQRIYSVRYEAVNAMLLNEFLKEHRTVEAQKTEVEGLKQSVAELKAMVEKLAGK
jgi:cell division protein FtsB